MSDHQDPGLSFLSRIWRAAGMAWGDLLTPTSAEAPPYTVAVSSIGHAVLGALLVALMGLSGLSVALAIGAAYWWIKERGDLRRAGQPLRCGAVLDGLEDAASVALGACYPGPWWWAAAVLVTVTGGVIPASGSVGVTLSQSVYTSANEDQNVPDGKVLRGWLAGIECEISGDGGSYQLTRVRSGTQKSVLAGLPFIDAWEQRHRIGTAQLLWIGRNGYGMSVLDYVAASVKFHLGPTLVLGVTTALTETAGTGAHTTITALNFALGQQYGARFFDVRAWLMSDGLASVSLTPTANDLADIAAGTIPRGLLAADGIHFNADGYHAIAIGVFQKLQSLGWEA